MLSQQGKQGQQQPGHLSKHCSRIRNIIAIAKQRQEDDTETDKKPIGFCTSLHIACAMCNDNVRIRFIHVKKIETPSFWWPLLQLPLQIDFVDITGPIVQIENIGVRMMGGNLIIVFIVPFKPMDIINTPST